MLHNAQQSDTRKSQITAMLQFVFSRKKDQFAEQLSRSTFAAEYWNFCAVQAPKHAAGLLKL